MLKFLLCFLLLGQGANAYVENRSIYPLGDSEAQMANTGVALSGSPAGAFFNPAGLAKVTVRKVSFTGSTFMAVQTSASPLVNFDGQDLGLTANVNQVVPSSLISTWLSGGWTYAFSIFVPELIKTPLNESYSTQNYDVSIARTSDSQFLLAGLSAGKAVTERFDIGFGCAAGQYQSSSAVSFNALPKTGSGLTTMLLSQIYSSIQVLGVLCQGGFQYLMAPGNRIGTVVRLPFQQLSGRGKYTQIVQEASGSRSTTGIRDVGARFNVPMDLGFGYANTSVTNWLFMIDLSYQLGDEFQPLDGYGGTTKIKGTLRYNFGSEYTLNKIWRLRGGLAINPSANVIQSSGDNTETYRVVTLGFQRSEGPTTFGLGLLLAQSSGDIMVSSTRTGSISTNVVSITVNSGFIF